MGGWKVSGRNTRRGERGRGLLLCHGNHPGRAVVLSAAFPAIAGRPWEARACSRSNPARSSSSAASACGQMRKHGMARSRLRDFPSFLRLGGSELVR